MRRTLAVTALLMLGVGACTSPAAEEGPTAGSTVAVVTSTNVYADIVRAVGGEAVDVRAIIDDPERDPHEYAADARNQLALSKAQVVVENGGGYDDFVDTMLRTASKQPVLINVTTVSGYDTEPAAGEFNEHLWYDFPTMTKLAQRIAVELTKVSPAQKAAIDTNLATFTSGLRTLENQAATIKKEHDGAGVAITEPVPLYLLQAAGLQNRTPVEFSEAIEEGTDVAPGVLRQTLDLFTGRQVRLLVYNQQTAGPQTEAVLAAARTSTVPVVPVTETLPAGETYLSWMGHNLDAVEQALSP